MLVATKHSMQAKTLIAALVALLDIVLILISGALLFTILGLSVMIFDAGTSPQAWSFFLTICGILLAIASVSLYIAIHYYRKKRYLLSLFGSALPAILFVVFQFALTFF